MIYGILIGFVAGVLATLFAIRMVALEEKHDLR